MKQLFSHSFIHSFIVSFIMPLDKTQWTPQQVYPKAGRRRFGVKIVLLINTQHQVQTVCRTRLNAGVVQTLYCCVQTSSVNSVYTYGHFPLEVFFHGLIITRMHLLTIEHPDDFCWLVTAISAMG